MEEDQVLHQLQQEIQQLKQSIKVQQNKFEEQKKLWDETKQQQLATIKKQNDELQAAKEQQKQQLDKFTEQQEIQAEQALKLQKLLDQQQEHQNRLPILQSANNKLSNEFLQLEHTNHQLESNIDNLKHENERLKMIEQEHSQQKQIIQNQLQQIQRMESVIKKLNHERTLYETYVKKLQIQNQTLKTDNEYFKTMREKTEIEYLNLSQLQNQKYSQSIGQFRMKGQGNSSIFVNKEQHQTQVNEIDPNINFDQENQVNSSHSHMKASKPLVQFKKPETVEKGTQTVQSESFEALQPAKQTPQKKWRKVVEKAQKTVEQKIQEEKDINIVREITDTLKKSNLIASSGVIDIALKSFRSDEYDHSQLPLSPSLQLNTQNMSSYIDLCCLNADDDKIKRDRAIEILTKIEAEPQRPFMFINVTKYRLYTLFKSLKLRNNGFVKLRDEFDLDESMYDILTKIQAGETVPPLSDQQLKMLDKVTQPEYQKYLLALGFKINSDYVHSRFGFQNNSPEYRNINIPDVIEIDGEEPLILDQQMKHILYQLQNNKEIDIELKPNRYQQLKKLVQVSNETLSKQLGFFIGLDTQHQLKQALEHLE